MVSWILSKHYEINNIYNFFIWKKGNNHPFTDNFFKTSSLLYYWKHLKIYFPVLWEVNKIVLEMNKSSFWIKSVLTSNCKTNRFWQIWPIVTILYSNNGFIISTLKTFKCVSNVVFVGIWSGDFWNNFLPFTLLQCYISVKKENQRSRTSFIMKYINKCLLIV